LFPLVIVIEGCLLENFSLTFFLFLKLKCNTFTGDELLQRREQLLQVYRYINKPHKGDVTKSKYLLMMAPPGSGKTRMINSISTSVSVLEDEIGRLSRIQNDLNTTLNNLKSKKKQDPKKIASTETSIHASTASITELRDVQSFIRENVIFLPITFNGEMSLNKAQTRHFDYNWEVVSRLIFSYYALDLFFLDFQNLVREELHGITPMQIIEAIRYDKMNQDDDPGEKSSSCRVFIMVDEIGLIDNEVSREAVFSLLKDSLMSKNSFKNSFGLLDSVHFS